jgi:hypothetical protein
MHWNRQQEKWFLNQSCPDGDLNSGPHLHDTISSSSKQWADKLSPDCNTSYGSLIFYDPQVLAGQRRRWDSQADKCTGTGMRNKWFKNFRWLYWPTHLSTNLYIKGKKNCFKAYNHKKYQHYTMSAFQIPQKILGSISNFEAAILPFLRWWYPVVYVANHTRWSLCQNSTHDPSGVVFGNYICCQVVFLTDKYLWPYSLLYYSLSSQGVWPR